MSPKRKDAQAEVYDSVTDGLKQLYRAKIRPVEEVRTHASPRRSFPAVRVPV
jgi:hypothetical protein